MFQLEFFYLLKSVTDYSFSKLFIKTFSRRKNEYTLLYIASNLNQLKNVLVQVLVHDSANGWVQASSSSLNF